MDVRWNVREQIGQKCSEEQADWMGGGDGVPCDREGTKMLSF